MASSAVARERGDSWSCGSDDPPGHLRWLVVPNLAQTGLVIGETTAGEGAARVECMLNSSGRPKNCVTTWEDPPGKGFGRMSAELAGLYKAASKDSLGQPTAGRKVCHAFGASGRSDGGPTG